MKPKSYPSLWLTTTLVVLLAGGWGFTRLFLFRESMLPLTFVLPLLLCVWTRRPWQLWLMAITFASMAIVKILWLMPVESLSAGEAQAYLAATLVNIAVGAVVIQFIMRLRDRLEAKNATVLAQNAELEAQAEELTQQNEEIRAQAEELAQQNEEIESQAEELERQNEELQETNDRLGSREEMLQAVLQSARASGGGRQALSEVCTRAMEILGEPCEALAVLELDGADALRLRAHARRETQPPLRERWPLEKSLAQVVLREDRTAYVDDLRERADLAAPFVVDGTIHTLLVTPLRVGGKHAGVVVACGRGVSHWTRDQFRLLEWVAAQCGLIVEGLHWQDALEARAVEVEAANRSKDQFLAMLSHELRTPLTPVLAAAGTLENDPRLPEDVREDLGVIRRNVGVQSRLIDDLLDLTRVGRGKLELHRQPVSVATLLRDTASIVAADLDAREQTLTVENELPSGCFVEGDGPRLQQVLWNLLKNAIKFSPANGRITLTARLTEGAEPRVSIAVADHGIGIDPADLQRIFLPFEQAALGPQRASGQGLGLGLCIAKAVVELHGGTLRVASEGAGRGATFTVELPVAEAPAAADAPQAAPAGGDTVAAQPGARPSPRPADATMRILLVEDHEDTGRLLGRLLKSRGHEVQHARDLAGAIGLFEAGTFDLVLSDLGLPDGSGLDLMRQIRAAQPNLAAICLSGYGMDGDIRASLEAGFNEHLTKPIDVQQLHAAIDRVAHGGDGRPRADSMS